LIENPKEIEFQCVFILISPFTVQRNVRLDASVSWKNAFYDFIHNWIVTDFRIQAGEALL